MAEGVRAVGLVSHIGHSHIHHSGAELLHHGVHLLRHLLKGVHWAMAWSRVAPLPSIIDGFESAAELAAKATHHRIHGISMVGEERVVVEKASSKHFYGLSWVGRRFFSLSF